MTNVAIVIDADVPLPSSRRGHTGRRAFYPFPDMEVGKSFLLECMDPAEKSRQQRNVLASAYQFCKRQGNNWVFTTRQVEEGVRVWRVK